MLCSHQKEDSFSRVLFKYRIKHNTFFASDICVKKNKFLILFCLKVSKKNRYEKILYIQFQLFWRIINILTMLLLVLLHDLLKGIELKSFQEFHRYFSNVWGRTKHLWPCYENIQMYHIINYLCCTSK